MANFIQVDFSSTVRLSAQDKKSLKLWLDRASVVMEKLIRKGALPGMPPGLVVSLLICGDDRIRTLNRGHRNKDKVTDVLSFPAHESLRRKIPAGEIFLGDMAICFPQARRQAREFDIGLWDEFVHLYFHGLLHLMGYDHEVSAKEERIMQKWEDSAIESLSELI